MLCCSVGFATVYSAMVSGRPAGQPPLPGWSGWDCSQRNCPTGDAIDRRHSGVSAVVSTH